VCLHCGNIAWFVICVLLYQDCLFLGVIVYQMPNKKKKVFKRVTKETPVKVSSCSNQSSFKKQYTPLQMTSALNAVLENGVSANMAAAMHGVPPSTLKDRRSSCIKHGDKPGPKPQRKKRS